MSNFSAYRVSTYHKGNKVWGGATDTAYGTTNTLLLVAGILAHTIFKSEPFSATPPLLNTQIAKTPRPLKASEWYHRVCDGAAENPEAPQKVQKIFRKPTALDPPNNAPSGPGGPPGPRARKAGVERPAAAPSLPFGFALWGSNPKISMRFLLPPEVLLLSLTRPKGQLPSRQGGRAMAEGGTQEN